MDNNQSADQPNCSGCQGIMWWATLTIAVLAVPAVGFMVVAASRTSGIAQLIIFVLACWLCTFLGMKLMQLPNMSKPIHPRKE